MASKHPSTQAIHALSPEKIMAIEEAVFNKVAPLVADPYFVLDVALEREAGYWYLRIAIASHGPALSLDLCEQISRDCDQAIDSLAMPESLSYYMEVTSPGLFRVLRKQREFDYFRGQPIRITQRNPLAHRKSKKTKLDDVVIACGVLHHFDAAGNTVYYVGTPDGPPTGVALTMDMTVSLNPDLQFPDEANEDDAAVRLE